MRHYLSQLKSDFSLSAAIAGFIAVVVGLTSSAVIVFEAARSLGLNTDQAGSWLGSMCVGMGFVSVMLSLYCRAPILTAWSTAGAAILVTGLVGVRPSDAIGAFVVSASLILLCGVTGIFEKLMNRIPLQIASALLAGVLLHFAVDSFVAFSSQPLLIGLMFLTYLCGRRFWPRWAMLGVLCAGVIVTSLTGLMQFDKIHFTATQFQFVSPTFSLPTLIGIGIPLFVVTMASQNLTGYSMMRVYGYQVPLSPLLTATGLANVIAAFFGGFTITLAAITAAVGMDANVHPDPRKRYISGVVSGALYIIVGLAAGGVTSLFSAFPREMVLAIAGFALLATIANSLETALHEQAQRKPAFITFVVSASGLTVFGIGSAFWGIVAGLITGLILVPTKK